MKRCVLFALFTAATAGCSWKDGDQPVAGAPARSDDAGSPDAASALEGEASVSASRDGNLAGRPGVGGAVPTEAGLADAETVGDGGAATPEGETSDRGAGTSGCVRALEVCDGIDNDCDYDVDEGCECVTGKQRPCGITLGACTAGTQTCEAGFWGACSGIAPTSEICDGKDNDCDGDIDEGFNLTLPCPTGGCPQSRVCSADGRSSFCANDERLFSAVERCDGIDNDCDGLVDRIVENGSVRSVCTCEPLSTLAIGAATNASIGSNTNLCAATQCGADRAEGLLVDGKCYPACLGSGDSGSDWGWENGASCLVPTTSRGRAASSCNGVPVGMAITYCLNCTVSDGGALPFAMCQSVPRFDLRAFGRGEVWLKVDYTYASSAPARVPVNLWFDTGDAHRKHLPLVRVGDVPGRRQALFRVQEACFTPSALFGSTCPGTGEHCSHCGNDERCGAVAACGEYDLSQAWLQVAAEFCEPGTGQHTGTVTVHQVDLVPPNCES